MTAIFNGIGSLCTKFFTLMPMLGPIMNGFIITCLTIGTFYWIYYMIRDPKKDGNYLSK